MRKRINENVYQACLTLLRGLAYPNENEENSQRERDILAIGNELPMKLFPSTSLGRLIGRQPELRYVVTTVARLCHCHTSKFAARLFFDMVFDRGGHEREVYHQHSYAKAPVKAVLSKIVESILSALSIQGWH